MGVHVYDVDVDVDEEMCDGWDRRVHEWRGGVFWLGEIPDS
jgi:hypothetical protein